LQKRRLIVTISHIHERKYTREELFKEQPRLAEAHHQSKIQVKDEFAIVSIVKGMTFALVELDSLQALELAALAGMPLALDGLDEGWNKTFVGTYFYVYTGQREDGAPTVQTKMIEGTEEGSATGSAAPDLAGFLSLTRRSKGGAMTLRARMIECALEDPATGSAASDLAGYLSLKEGPSNETLSYEIVQGVEMGRRSEIFVDVEMGKDNISEIFLEGGAVRVMEGRLTV
jgi:predicted PhzF superfamily epimerase YddE/YHI9